MSRFISILVASSLSLVTLAASPGCGSDDAPSCASLVTHTAKLAGMELEGDKRTQALARCEKMPAKVRACAGKAQSIEALAACGK
ncbi:MAG: hypothetical protein KBG28_06100 [Kofleriaceae bacterium]|jgi:hypothetical protein|nr:hypothetical protein [Kofleriaceae bacterium]MBP6835990.1 hypothetical protein [Kofleriaceae bacterium]MBP9203517.1 hypothetical protein [Kofleriaceae bacterium]